MTAEAGAPPPTRWAALRRLTPARVALGRAGNALPTAALLDLQEAQARARDAVWSALDEAALEAAVAPILSPLGLPVLRAASEAAPDRRTYLLRPDLGRRLRAESRTRLAAAAAPGALAFVVADGLSASGVQAGAPALLTEALPRLAGAGVPLGPVVVAVQGRVALGDAIGEALGAAMVAVLIGERPGLSAPESMGVYLTFDPRPGRTDAERNCLSNIRPGGLSAREAAETLAWLVGAARRLGATGVALKDERPGAPPPLPPSPA